MFGFFRKRGRAASPPLDESRPVSFVDVYGRTLEMPLGRWRDDVLLPAIKASWNDPDRLYTLVLDGLREQLFVAMDGPSHRLVVIDPLVERSHVLRGIVLTKLGRLRDARAVLREARSRTGDSGVLLTNEAKVLAERGDLRKAMHTLDRGLRLDPNQDNGLGWRVAVLTEDRGEAAAERYLRDLAVLPQAWRPQLVLGLRELSAGRRDEALAWFDDVLARAAHEPDVMTGISGSLGQHGFIADAVGLVAPLYDERRDDPRAGLNLLQSYLELGDAEAGTALLERMYALRQPVLSAPLQTFARAFDELVRQAPEPLDDVPKIDLLRLVMPPWLLGMEDMSWAVPPRDPAAPRIVVLPLAAPDRDAPRGVLGGREDEKGRLSRGLPLLLLEQLIHCSDLRVAMNLPVANGRDLVLFGSPVSDDELDFLANDDDYAVEGDIVEDDGRFHVVARLRRLADRHVLARVERTFGREDAGDALIAVGGELLTTLSAETGRVIEPRHPHYTLPASDATQYISALGQTLALTLARTPDGRRGLYGERNIYGWMQSLAVNLADNEAAQFMYFTALAKGRRAVSPIVDEFEVPAVQRMRELREGDRYATRLLPLLAAIYPANDAVLDMLASSTPPSDPAYAGWCGRIAAAFPVTPRPPSS